MAAILIIDDAPDFRDSLSETLADLGHASVSAATARAGLAALDTADFDAMLLDFRLSDGDGLEVWRGMAPACGPPAPPVIMLTAFASPDNTIEAMKLGAFDHLTKPIGRADLEAVLARALKYKYVPRGALPLLAQEASGTIAANPNPCVIERHQKMCTSSLTWSTQNVRHARVYVVSEGSRGREESQFSGSRSCESCKAPWIERRPYTFTLYDYSRGRPRPSVEHGYGERPVTSGGASYF